MIEARCLARRLRERLDAGWPVFDRALNATRPAHPGDIALLFRAMTDLWPYESALADEGFDYHTIGGSAFYAQQEVHDVVNVLSVVEDPFDEVAMAGALRSPFFCVSDEGLFWLATQVRGRRPHRGNPPARRDHQADRPRPSPPRAGQAPAQQSGARPRITSRWRRWWPGSSTSRASRRPWSASFSASASWPTRGRSSGWPATSTARSGFTLADSSRGFADDLENEPREEQAATTDEASASIRLMSIHQAKGLEFPIVVLPDLARSASSRSPLVALHPELGLVARPAEASPGSIANPEPNPTEPAADLTAGSFAWQAYLTLEKADDEQESLRLFYVAATRARDALILSAGLGPDEPVKSSSAAMKLLDECFDRRTGLCRVASVDLVATPAVHVSLISPPAPRVDRTSTSNHLPISAIEEAITRATPVDRQDASRPSPPPRYLDLDPAAGLPPRAARLDGLIRAISRSRLETRRGARLDRDARRGSTDARREPGPDPRGRPSDGCLVGRPALPGAQERRPVLHQARLRIHDSAHMGWLVLGTDRLPRRL